MKIQYWPFSFSISDETIGKFHMLEGWFPVLDTLTAISGGNNISTNSREVKCLDFKI